MTNAAKVSVTEVRNALRCPRVFTLGRLRGNAVAFPVGSSCLGGAFHRIVDRFTQTVSVPPELFAALPESATVEARAEGLQRWLLAFLVEELEREPSYRNMPAEVDDLAEALRQLATHLAQRGRQGRPAEAIQSLLRAGERPLESAIEEASVVLTGRIDALYARADERFDVVEYKLTDPENAAVDRAQVALYRELLKRSERIAARPVILRFNPTLSVVEVPEPEADALVKDELLPLLKHMAQWLADPDEAPATTRRDLCSACPVAVPCAQRYPALLVSRDDPPANAALPRPSESGQLTAPAPLPSAPAQELDGPGKMEAAAIRQRVLDELRKDGIAVTSPEPIVGARVYTFPIVRPRGSVAQLDRAAQDVIHRLHSSLGIDATYERRGAVREVVVTRKHPRSVLLKPLLEAKAKWLSERAGRFVLGEKSDGEIVTGDLGDSATPHLLIGGQAGSGKSWLLRALVASLTHWHGPESLRLTLLDPKRVTFTDPGFRAAIESKLDGPLLYGLEDALPCLDRFIEIMEERYVAFEKEQVADLLSFNEVCGDARRLPRHLIVIDEFQDLTADRKASEVFCTAVGRLGAKARAAGIHLILATQRPDRQTVPPILKANLGGKIALRVASAINSRIILDQPGAELLLGRGLIRAQAAQL
jgi:S-DNA-T family DNA segregation ATPase FtsK/SpoIIIE